MQNILNSARSGELPHHISSYKLPHLEHRVVVVLIVDSVRSAVLYKDTSLEFC